MEQQRPSISPSAERTRPPDSPLLFFPDAVESVVEHDTGRRMRAWTGWRKNIAYFFLHSAEISVQTAEGNVASQILCDFKHEAVPPQGSSSYDVDREEAEASREGVCLRTPVIARQFRAGQKGGSQTADMGNGCSAGKKSPW